MTPRDPQIRPPRVLAGHDAVAYTEIIQQGIFISLNMVPTHLFVVQSMHYHCPRNVKVSADWTSATWGKKVNKAPERTDQLTVTPGLHV